MLADSAKVHNRLRRIEGQVRGIQRMVDDDVYCIDVITQISAVRTALEQVAVQVLSAHVQGCVLSAVKVGEQEGREKVDELMEAVNSFAKLK